MIFSDLQNAVAARLLWDSYFTEPKREVAVLAENALDLLTEYQKAVDKMRGTAVVVATPEVTETERVDLVNVRVALDITENVQLNRGSSGARKPASDVGAKGMALLRGWRPSEIWAPLEFAGLVRAGEDEAQCDHWILTMRTQLMLDLIVWVIGTETGEAIGDQAGKAFVVTPTVA